MSTQSLQLVVTALGEQPGAIWQLPATSLGVYPALCSGRFASRGTSAGRDLPRAGGGMPAGGQQRRMLEAARSRRRRPTRCSPVAGLLGWRGWPAASAWWRGLTVMARWLAGAAAVIAAGGVVAGLLAAFSVPPPVGERPYLSFTGCLLTDAQGITGPQAAPAWAGLQDAAAATRMQAQYLAVPASATNAGPYLASLVTQRCGLIVAAGPDQVAAVASEARQFSTVRFVVVGGSATGANVTRVGGTASSVRSQVDGLARAALSAGAG